MYELLYPYDKASGERCNSTFYRLETLRPESNSDLPKATQFETGEPGFEP